MKRTPRYGAFDDESGADMLYAITAGLEAHLVSFVHRVRFAYATHYAETRAAAVLVTKLAQSGLSAWVPPEDATPPLIARAFQAYFARCPDFEPEHRQAIEADIAEFARCFADPDAIEGPPSPDHVDGALRAIGAEPDAWSWARPFAGFARAWEAGDSPPRRTPQIALAAGVSFEVVVGCLAAALLREAKLVTGSRLESRDTIFDVLGRLAAGAAPATMRAQTRKIRAACKTDSVDVLARFRAVTTARDVDAIATHVRNEDPMLDFLRLTAELLERTEAAVDLGALDPYWAGDFVEKLVRHAKSDDALGTLRAELEPAVLAAIGED